MTRTAALGIIAVLLCACAHDPGDRVSTTTTTGYTPTGLELYLAQSTSKGCPKDLQQSVHFESGTDVLSPAELVDVQQWASCLTQREMKDETVVLTGGRDPDPDDPLFTRRAEAIRSELARRGVDPSRVVFGAANATRGGGRMGPSDDVRFELSTSSTLRAMR
jgi:hypothetical protein